MAVVVGMLAFGMGLTWVTYAWLPAYSVLAVVGWMLLVLTFIVAHAPEKTMAEIIRESR